MRKTKIICTLGPSTDKGDVLRELIANGMNVARFNFSHGSYEEHGGRLANLKALREELGKPVAALLDTKGPEIRLKEFKNGVEMLEAGQTFTLTTREVEGTKEICSVTYKDLPHDVHEGGTIMLDDGLIMLRIEKVTDTDITCTVLNSGKIKTKKGVNVPGVHLSMPYLSQKDREDIIFGIQNGFDFIAASFVRTAQDVYDIRNLLNEYDSNIRIIAKIENREGVNNIDSILSAADAVMVARGDLGVEIPAEQIPVAQRLLVSKCIESKKPVIIATQMLHTMITHPRPTRAEISDVANAIYQRVDAVMLSGETANGQYPVEAVKTMARVAREIEKDTAQNSPNYDMNLVRINNEITAQLSRSAVRACINLPIRAIIIDTLSGRTGRYLAAFRGEKPVYAVCYRKSVMRQLGISYGIHAMYREPTINHESFLLGVLYYLEDRKWLCKEDMIVVIGGSFGAAKGASFLEIGNVLNLEHKALNAQNL